MLNQSFSGDLARTTPLTLEVPPVQDPNRSPNMPSGANSPIQTIATVAADGVGQTPVLCNPQHRGLSVFINLSVNTAAAGTLTVSVWAIDPVSGQRALLLVSLGITALNTPTLLQIYPGLPATANVSANAVLPSQYQITWAVTGAAPTVNATIALVLQP